MTMEREKEFSKKNTSSLFIAYIMADSKFYFAVRIPSCLKSAAIIEHYWQLQIDAV